MSPPRSTPEREARLSAGRDYRLPELRGLLDGLAATPKEDQRLWTVYFDSEDLRLARWGISLGFRHGEGWTVKVLDRETAALLGRDEVWFAGAAGNPPPGALDLIGVYLRGADLRPCIRLHTIRRGVVLRGGNGRLLADVVDDTVSILDGQRVVGAFRELEIATAEDTPRRLGKALVARLGAAGAGPPDPTPRYLRALGGARVAPAEITLPELSGGSSLGDVVTHAIADAVIRLVRHDPVVRLQAHPEGIHQARVATRRLRSDLRTFRSVLQPGWAATLRAELGWLGAELGAARDADVLFERLTEKARALRASNEAGPVIEALSQHRRQAYARSLSAVRSDRYIGVIDRLIEAAQAPALLEPKASGSAAEELPAFSEKAWRELRKRATNVSDPPTDEELHAVRILAKRARYAAEASSPPLGKRVRRFAAASRNLQDVLGELNDAVVAERWVRTWALQSGLARECFVAGELSGLEWAAAQRARLRWSKRWRKLNARRPVQI